MFGAFQNLMRKKNASADSNANAKYSAEPASLAMKTAISNASQSARETSAMSSASNLSSATSATATSPCTSAPTSNNRQCVGIDSVDPALLEESYYHGVVQRAEVEQRLHKDGDFLLCIPEEYASGVKTFITLAVMTRKRVRYFAIGKTEKRRYHIGSQSFDSIPQLVAHYQRTREVLNTDIPTVLKNPIALPDWVIAHSQLMLAEELGRGAYGRVYKAMLKSSNGDYRIVAVKQFNVSQSGSQSRSNFLKEAKAMKLLKHANLVSLIGVATQQEPLMLVLEFCGGGCLLSYLRAHSPTTPLNVRFRFATEASSGLRYLESQGQIHRDVAARNCLLSDELICKIGDFGLSLKDGGATASASPTAGERFPIKWLAPEVLKYKTFSLKSDVWAFGVLLYEIFTQGAEPYPQMSTKEVRERLIGVEKFRMQMPLDVPPVIERMVERCWEEYPDKRPTFRILNKELIRLKIR